MKSTHSTQSTDDFRAAVAYVQRKLATELGWLGEDDTRDHAARIAWPRAKRDPLAFSPWCPQWLDRHQRRPLQAAVRAARKRRRDHRGHRDPPVNVTLSRQAWLIFSALARREGLTLSQWLIARHDADWLQM
jgi:macrodomain Ter protein organizer (MatP/YcbG family)